MSLCGVEIKNIELTKITEKEEWKRYYLLCTIFVLISSFKSIPLCFAHEPIFGIGPETIFKYGTGIETEVEYEKGKSDSILGLYEEILFGLRQDLSITLRVPYIIQKKAPDSIANGLGDLVLRGKFRFFKKDYSGASNKLALVGGVKFPTGNKKDTPPLSTGSFDFIVGLTAGHESRRWYLFSDIRYRYNTKGDSVKKGDRLLYDFAAGVRPALSEYYKPDLVMLLELSGELRNKDRVNSLIDNNSGGSILYLGPSFLWSYRNWMLKGGIQVALYQNLSETETENIRSSLAIEIHF